MHSVYSVDARDTCEACGGEALMDSKIALRLRQIEKEKRRKIDRENARLLKEHR
jgi:hypothetical protein